MKMVFKTSSDVEHTNNVTHSVLYTKIRRYSCDIYKGYE